jgi:hypothetical protein
MTFPTGCLSWPSAVVSDVTHCKITYTVDVGLIPNFGLIVQIMTFGTFGTVISLVPITYPTAFLIISSAFWVWYSGWTNVSFSIINLALKYCHSHVNASFKRDIPVTNCITQPYPLLYAWSCDSSLVVAFVTSLLFLTSIRKHFES